MGVAAVTPMARFSPTAYRAALQAGAATLGLELGSASFLGHPSPVTAVEAGAAVVASVIGSLLLFPVFLPAVLASYLVAKRFNLSRRWQFALLGAVSAAMSSFILLLFIWLRQGPLINEAATASLWAAWTLPPGFVGGAVYHWTEPTVRGALT